MTISPTDSVGTSCVSIQVSKMRLFIGASTIHGAVRPWQRSPAMKGLCLPFSEGRIGGKAPAFGRPSGAFCQARIREVPSIKMRRDKALLKNRFRRLIQRSRALAISGLRCSLALRLFFYCSAQVGVENDLPLNFHPTAIRASAVLTTPIGVLVATGGNAKLSYCAALEPVAAMDPA